MVGTPPTVPPGRSRRVVASSPLSVAGSRTLTIWRESTPGFSIWNHAVRRGRESSRPFMPMYITLRNMMNFTGLFTSRISAGRVRGSIL
nr:hypothetical protein GCM10020093_010570 [Planobispora longispora]